MDKNDKGFILAAVLAMTVLVMLLGTAAIKMSELGYLAFGSERKYQVAGTAAEFAINTAILSVSTTGNCPSANTGTLSTGGVNASFTSFSVAGGNNCFIHSKGSFGGASVVKTTVVPTLPTGNWAALVIQSGTLDLGGSGAVAFCDTACPNGGPAVLYVGATTIDGTTSVELPVDCPNNPRGAVGNPPTTQNSSLPSDLTSTYFDSTDWTDLESDLRTKYSVDSASLASLSASCKYTGTSACGTTSATNISCGATNINLTTCSTVYIQQAALTIDQAVTGRTIYSGAKVTVTGGTTNTNVFADSIDINLEDNNSAGGVYFSRNTSSTKTTNNVYVKSSHQLGTEANPIMFIAKGGTTFASNGGPDVYAFIYTSSTAIDVNGGIKFKGSFINDNAATLKFGGNAVINFDLDVLRNLRTNLSGFLKPPACAERQTNSSLVSTKVTVY